MKPLFIVFFSILIFSFTSASSQSKATFIIDNESYIVDQRQLNDFFGMAFNELLKVNIAKQSSYELWVRSYEAYKKLAMNGTNSWDVYYNKIANNRYQGDWIINANLGLDDKGKLAKGNPNKKQNHASRIAYLNAFMGKYITNHFTNKTIN